MSICRALPVVALLIALPQVADAQFGGMPGMPGSPGMPGGFGAAPSAPPPACQELLTIQSDVQKNASAIQNASKKHASPVVACKLFQAFLSSESRMLKSIERNGSQCGVPAEVPRQIKAGHAKAEKIAKQVCEVAANGGRPAAPSLSDAFGGAPVLPDGSTKKRGGAFDSLSGNVLAR